MLPSLLTKLDDHNLRENEPNSRSSARSRQPQRNHRTLSSAIDSFLELNRPNSPEDVPPQTVQDTFVQALLLLATEEGSQLAFQLLDTINLEGNEGLDGGKQGGVTDEFLDSLERVALKDVPNKETADCPICTNLFVDNEYPLLVRLPCKVQHASGIKSKGHIFDMDCIAPWLKMNSTCPLCRFDVMAAEKTRREKLEEELRKLKEEDEEEEEEGWDVYG